MNHTIFSMNSSFLKIYVTGIFIVLTSVLSYSTGNQCKAQSDQVKIEPPNWWVQMPTQNVQLMCYGQGIGDARVKINNESVSLVGTHKAESPNYLFLDVFISENAQSGEVNVKFIFPDESVKEVMYPLFNREKFIPQAIDGSDIIYLITPDRFANGDLSNDSRIHYKESPDLKNLFGRHGGDIAGISDYVSYIDSMGFTAIWSSPLLVNDQPKASYHGYAATDLYSIDERMGSLASYVALAEQLHARDMKLIMDFVPNHIGHKHWWMDDLPFKNWINGDGSTLTHHNRNVMHDPYAIASEKEAFTTGWFVETMPDLNQRNPFMHQYLLQNAIWWVETAKLDGLRIDTYPYSDHGFMNSWSCTMRDLYPTLRMIGEEWTTNPDYIAYWQEGSERNPATCLPSLFDFPLQEAIVKSLSEEESWNTGWVHLHEALSKDYLYPGADDLVIFLDNHDMDRIYRQLDGSFWKFRFGLTILMTMRGIPQVYYGTELLFSNTISNNHGDIRSHFPGTWPNDEYDARKANQIPEPSKSAQVLMHKLTALRQTSSAIQHGDLIQALPKNGVFSYIRRNEEQTIMVILNKSDESKSLNWEVFRTHLPLGEAIELFTGVQVKPGEEVEIDGKEAMILIWNHGVQ